jgi:CheY-like chemotaxis protein
MSRQKRSLRVARDSSSAEHTSSEELRSKTVLIVDDDEDIRRTLALLFELEEFQVVGQAANGDQALAMARRHQPAFVILDYLMPNMTGEEAARWIRLVDPEARIIAVSAIIRSAPDWSDAFVSKRNVLDVVELPERLLAET